MRTKRRAKSEKDAEGGGRKGLVRGSRIRSHQTLADKILYSF